MLGSTYTTAPNPLCFIYTIIFHFHYRHFFKGTNGVSLGTEGGKAKLNSKRKVYICFYHQLPISQDLLLFLIQVFQVASTDGFFSSYTHFCPALWKVCFNYPAVNVKFVLKVRIECQVSRAWGSPQKTKVIGKTCLLEIPRVRCVKWIPSSMCSALWQLVTI